MDWAAAVQGVLSANAEERGAAESAIARCSSDDALALVTLVTHGRLGQRNIAMPAREAAAVLLVPVLLGARTALSGSSASSQSFTPQSEAKLWALDGTTQDQVMQELMYAATRTSKSAPKLQARIAHAVAAMAEEYGEEWPALKQAFLEILADSSVHSQFSTNVNSGMQSNYAGDVDGQSGLLTAMLVAVSAPETIMSMFSGDEEVQHWARALQYGLQRADSNIQVAVAALNAVAAVGPYVLGQDRRTFQELATQIVPCIQSCAQVSSGALETAMTSLAEMCYESTHILGPALFSMLQLILAIIDSQGLSDEIRILGIECLAGLCERLPSSVRQLQQDLSGAKLIETLMRTIINTLEDDAPLDVLQDGGISSPCAAASAACIGRLAVSDCLGANHVGAAIMQLAQDCLQNAQWKPVVAGIETVAQLVDAHCLTPTGALGFGREVAQVDQITTEVLSRARDWAVAAITQHADLRVQYTGLACLGTLSSHPESVQFLPGFRRSVSQVVAAGLANEHVKIRQCSCEVVEALVLTCGLEVSELSGFEVVVRKLREIVTHDHTNTGVWQASLYTLCALSSDRAMQPMMAAQFDQWAPLLSSAVSAPSQSEHAQSTHSWSLENRVRAGICLAGFCKAVGQPRASTETIGLIKWATQQLQDQSQSDLLRECLELFFQLWVAIVQCLPAIISAEQIAPALTLARQTLEYSLENAQEGDGGDEMEFSTEAARHTVGAWELLGAIATYTPSQLLQHVEWVFEFAQAQMDLDVLPDIYIATAQALAQIASSLDGNESDLASNFRHATMELLLQAISMGEEDPDLQSGLLQVVQKYIQDAPELPVADTDLLCTQLLSVFESSIRARAILQGQQRLYMDPQGPDADELLVNSMAEASNSAFRVEIIRTWSILGQKAPHCFSGDAGFSLISGLAQLALPHRLLEDRMLICQFYSDLFGSLRCQNIQFRNKVIRQVVETIVLNVLEERRREEHFDRHESLIQMSCFCAVHVKEFVSSQERMYQAQFPDEFLIKLCEIIGQEGSEHSPLTRCFATIATIWMVMSSNQSESQNVTALWISHLPLPDAAPRNAHASIVRALTTFLNSASASSLSTEQQISVAQNVQEYLARVNSQDSNLTQEEQLQARQTACALLARHGI